MKKNIFRMAVCADIHFQERERLGILRDGIDTRFQDKLDSFKAMIAYAVSNDVDAVVVLGDAFDYADPGDFVRAQIAKILSPYLKQKSKCFIFLKGNHDGAGQVSPWLSESYLADGFYVVDRPTVLTEPFDGRFSVLCLPDCVESRDVNVLKKLKNEFTASRLHPLVLGHGPIVGMGTEYFKAERGFPVKWFQAMDAELVLFGDIHKRQMQTWPSKNGREPRHYGYVGCLCRQKFDEREYETGFAVVDVGVSGRTQFDFMDVPDRPFYQFEFNEESTLWAKIPEAVAKPYIKAIFEGSTSWMHSDGVQNLITHLDARAMRCIVEYRPVHERVKLSLTSKGFSVEDAFEAYVVKHKVPADMIAVGRELLKSTRSQA